MIEHLPRYGALMFHALVDADLSFSYEWAFNFVRFVGTKLFHDPGRKVRLRYELPDNRVHTLVATAKNFEKIWAYCEDRQLRGLHLCNYSQEPSILLGASNGPEVYLTTGIRARYGDKGNLPDYFGILIPADIAQSNPALVADVAALFQKAIAEMPVLTGFVDFENSPNSIDILGGYTSFERVHNLRIAPVAYYRSRCIGFNWINLLTEGHIALLGGHKSIVEKYPLSRMINNALMCLQVTDSVFSMTIKDYLELYEFLVPVLPPKSTIDNLTLYIEQAQDRLFNQPDPYSVRTHLFFDLPADYEPPEGFKR